MNRPPTTALELRDSLRSGDLSALEVAEHFLGRVETRADLGAFVTVTAEQALREALLADERTAATPRGERDTLPPLHGLPLAHKDLVDVAGTATSHGSAALPHRVARRDDSGVSVLRSAGAVSLGKTQVPELGLTGYSENSIAPPARNPLDPTRTPGGSSGGSAAAVAAGLLPFAPGSDGGGSIRIPSLACGLIGLKPGRNALPSDRSRGAVDRFGGPRMTVAGPIARTAADAALLFDTMRGDRHETTLDAVGRADRLSRLRIGVSTRSPFEAVFPIALSPEATRALDTAVDRLEDRAHRVEEADLRYAAHYPETFTSAWTAGLSLLRFKEPDVEERLMPLTRTFRERALNRPEEDHRAAGARLTEFAGDVEQQWGAYDAVLTPGLAMIPPRIGAFLALGADEDYRLQCEWAPFTSMVNVVGLPAVAVPILTLPNGLSMGVQLIGRRGSEAQLLQLAAQLADG